MVRHYAYLSADPLAPYAERLCATLIVKEKFHGTTMAQSLERQRCCRLYKPLS